MANLKLVTEPLDRGGLLRALHAFRKGDFSVRLAADQIGLDAEVAKVFNQIAETNQAIAAEFVRIREQFGKEGQIDRRIRVPEASGAWLDLVDTMNALLAGTQRNAEQDWLKGNLAKFARMLRGERDLAVVSKRVLSELAPLIGAQQGVLYVQRGSGDEARLELLAAYAPEPGQNLPRTLRIGESLVGQCAQERKRILLDDVPREYVRVGSVLGSMTPLAVIILPVPFEGEVKAVIELAALKRFSETQLAFLEQLADSLGVVLHGIDVAMRTETLLWQSRALAEELQKGRDDLKRSNERLEQQAQSLQKSEGLLRKRQEELERSNAQLGEKAEQLTLASQYKSQFLASMSHELRTPLNSLLILARLLVDNPEKNLKPKQVEYARTIHAAGTDLLTLINDILDLAKIESGTVVVDVDRARISDLIDYVERTFRQIAQDKRLQFEIRRDDAVPATIQTDIKRLQQILKNLLANAFKFTDTGKVSLRVTTAESGWTPGQRELEDAFRVVAFVVEDTGIGIPEAKRAAIFEAFQQGDDSVGAHYGGTGLGLSICRQLTRLLGGEIRVESRAGAGSRFTLYLPLNAAGDSRAAVAVRPSTPLSAPEAAAAPPQIGTRLAGRTVLLIDDDIRNIFALTGALEEHGIKVIDAESGKSGLDLLKRQPGIDAILMDIMMPDLNGFDSIRLIRGLKQFRDLPIIAVTARAMKGDREKCIEAGATDYIAKPVDVNRLVSLLEVWLVK